MRKMLLIALVACVVPGLNAQLQKGDNLVTVHGSYLNYDKSSGVSTNMQISEINQLNSGISLSFVMSRSFLLGFGVDFISDNEIRKNVFTAHNSFFQQELMELKSSVLLPNLFVTYFYNITDKLYFSAGIKAGVGEINSEINGAIVRNSLNSSAIQGSNSTYAQEQKTDYAAFTFQPGFTYFLSKRVGLSVGLGGIEYSLTNMENPESHLIFGINPAYWQVGISIKI